MPEDAWKKHHGVLCHLKQYKGHTAAVHPLLLVQVLPPSSLAAGTAATAAPETHLAGVPAGLVEGRRSQGLGGAVVAPFSDPDVAACC